MVDPPTRKNPDWQDLNLALNIIDVGEVVEVLYN